MYVLVWYKATKPTKILSQNICKLQNQLQLILLYIILLIQLTTKRPYYMAYSVGNKMALLYGLFNWRQNGLKWPYYMAYSIDNKTALIYGLFN